MALVKNAATVNWQGVLVGAVFRAAGDEFLVICKQKCLEKGLQIRIVVYNCDMTNFAFTWRDFSFFAFTNRGN